VARLGQWRLAVSANGARREVPLSKSACFGEALGGTVVMRAIFARLELAAVTQETASRVRERSCSRARFTTRARGAIDRSSSSIAVNGDTT
jgi:hypothetical protein